MPIQLLLQKILALLSLTVSGSKFVPTTWIISNTPHEISIGLTTKIVPVRQRRDPLSDHSGSGLFSLYSTPQTLAPGKGSAHQPTQSR